MEKVIVRKNGANVELVVNDEVITTITRTKKEGDGTYSYIMPQIEGVTVGLQKYVRTKYVTEEGYELQGKIVHVQSSNQDGEKKPKAKAKYAWLEYANEEELLILDEIRKKCEARIAKAAKLRAVEIARAEYEAAMAEYEASQEA